jgi:hypothetical protein
LTSLLHAARRGSQKPRVANFPAHPFTAAPEAIDLAALTGLHLDDWQQYVLEHGMGHNADESWTARKVSVWVPRQNGKGGIIEALELFWLFIEGAELIVHTAHQNRTATKAYKRMERLIKNDPDLLRQVRQFRIANGEHQIELLDGRMLQYSTRSDTATRGFSTPRLVLDEAQELDEDDMAAILPTVSAMPNWQVWFFGTPPNDPRAWVYGLKEDGEAGVERLAHFDWGLDLNPDDPDDKARLHDLELAFAANPAMGDAPGCRIEVETVLDEMRPSGLGVKYPQERLGVWQPRAVEGNGAIDMVLWQLLADPHSRREGDFTIVADVTPERDRGAIAITGRRADGLAHWQVIDDRPGVDWIVPRLAELKRARSPLGFAVDGKGPASSLVPDLKKVGIRLSDDSSAPQRGDLMVFGPQHVADAWGMFVDAARQKRGRHCDQAELTSALAGAKTRNLGDGGQAWGRRGSAPIASLVAVTGANYLYEIWAHLIVADTTPNVW